MAWLCFVVGGEEGGDGDLRVRGPRFLSRIIVQQHQMQSERTRSFWFELEIPSLCAIVKISYVGYIPLKVARPVRIFVEGRGKQRSGSRCGMFVVRCAFVVRCSRIAEQHRPSSSVRRS